jgi:hypothetical protein
MSQDFSTAAIVCFDGPHRSMANNRPRSAQV